MGPPNGDYQNLAGGIAASQDGLNYVVLLSTFTGNGRVASILYITTDERLFDLFDRFNSSLKLNKPKAAQAPPQNLARPPQQRPHQPPLHLHPHHPLQRRLGGHHREWLRAGGQGRGGGAPVLRDADARKHVGDGQRAGAG